MLILRQQCRAWFMQRLVVPCFLRVVLLKVEVMSRFFCCKLPLKCFMSVELHEEGGQEEDNAPLIKCCFLIPTASYCMFYAQQINIVILSLFRSQRQHIWTKVRHKWAGETRLKAHACPWCLSFSTDWPLSPQETHSLHSSPHPCLRHPLYGVCTDPRACWCGASTLPRVSVGILPGEFI